MSKKALVFFVILVHLSLFVPSQVPLSYYFVVPLTPSLVFDLHKVIGVVPNVIGVILDLHEVIGVITELRDGNDQTPGHCPGVV